MDDCRRQISDLVREAVEEPNADRRQALLVMADHWSELLRLRTRPARSLTARGRYH